MTTPDEVPRFTVEPVAHQTPYIGTHAIRYTPRPRKNADGSTSYSLSFHCLIAGDALANAETVLQQVADVLNASEIGR